MTTKHTPEPWRQFTELGTIGDVVDSKGRAVAQAQETGNFERGAPEGLAERNANAARIVACVNGCAGINPEAVKDLLAALKDAEFLLRKAGQVAGPMQDSFNRSAVDARAAIAKAEGE